MEVSILRWFVVPAVITFFLVNLFQISPLLASWTTVSVLGMEGANLHWVVLIVVYSLLLALVGGLSSYYLVSRSARRSATDRQS